MSVCERLPPVLHNASYDESAIYTAMEISHIEAGYALLAATAQATSGDRDKIMVALPVPGDASLTEREPVDSNGAPRLPTVDPSNSRLPLRLTMEVRMGMAWDDWDAERVRDVLVSNFTGGGDVIAAARGESVGRRIQANLRTEGVVGAEVSPHMPCT
jgi:hypothetical protein